MNLFEIQRRAQEAQEKAPPADQGENRDMQGLYQTAYEFHAQHRPRLDPLYWPETVKALGSILADHGGDPLLTDLLQAVYSDLEREYIKLLEAGA